MALASGDPARSVPLAFGIAVAAVVFVVTRVKQKRQFARMLRSADPLPLLHSFGASLRRMPHGSFVFAANTATVLALYGRFDDAERALAAVSWADVPPFIQAQESAARATLAYARGSISEGLDHAVAATQQASLNVATPGARTSELAFRTYRNLGHALSGRETDTTSLELHAAFAQLPLLGRLIAAWGLAVIAKSRNSSSELQQMHLFIKTTAPHCSALLRSSGAG